MIKNPVRADVLTCTLSSFYLQKCETKKSKRNLICDPVNKVLIYLATIFLINRLNVLLFIPLLDNSSNLKALYMVTTEAVQYNIRGNQTILCEKHMKNNEKKRNCRREKTKVND